MISFKKKLLLTIFAVCCVQSCGTSGDRGGSGGGGKVPDPVNPPLPSPLHTSVGIYPNGHKSLDVSSCVRLAEYSLPTTAAEFQLDGLFGDWANIPALLTDSIADAPAVIDLSQIQVASHLGGLAFALAFVPSSGINLYFELGGVLSRDNVIRSEVKHLVKVGASGTFEFRSGVWELLPPDFLTIIQGPQGMELFASDRLVGDTVSWPAWWVRIVSEDSATEKWDSTSAAYFPSVLGGDSVPFSFSKCTQWAGKPSAVSQLMITHQVAPPLNPSDDYIADGTFDIRREHALQLGRYALDLALSLTDDLPYGSVVNTVLISDFILDGVLETGTLKHPVIDNGATYRALGINTKNMGFRPEVYFPQGETIDQGLNFHLRHLLKTHFQTAGLGAISAVSVGISHSFLNKYISQQYWFDHRWPQIAEFLTVNDVKDPLALDLILEKIQNTPLSQQKLPTEFFRAKVRAAGQLLGEYFSPQELIGAWKSATLLGTPAMPTEEKTALFARALFANLTKDDFRAALKQMFNGYFTSQPYHADFGPNAHDDKDKDGLPLFVERMLGTKDDNQDSDEDGWSDLVEHTGGFNPLSASEVPGLLVADGIFSEWQNLLASKIIVDKGHSGLCEKDADIQFYAAIGDRDHLIIGAVAGEFWSNESKARWEVVVDIPSENRSLLIVAPNKERVVKIYEPVKNKLLMTYPQATPAGGKVAEILVDRIAMRLSTPFNKERAIRLRLRTAYESDEGDIFCDETGWFEPYVK